MKWFASLFVFLLMPALALAGVFGEVITGDVEPEIYIISDLNSTPAMVGKIYYWSSEGLLETNGLNPVYNAEPVITTAKNISLSVAVIFWDIDSYDDKDYFYCPFCGDHSDSVYERYSGVIQYTELMTSNAETVTLFYDRDNIFGNGNEIEIRDFNPETSPFYQAFKHYYKYCSYDYCYGSYAGLYYSHNHVRDYVVPENYSQREFAGATYCISDKTDLGYFDENEDLYLVIRADSFGLEDIKGDWKISLGLEAV